MLKSLSRQAAQSFSNRLLIENLWFHCQLGIQTGVRIQNFKLQKSKFCHRHFFLLKKQFLYPINVVPLELILQPL